MKNTLIAVLAIIVAVLLAIVFWPTDKGPTGASGGDGPVIVEPGLDGEPPEQTDQGETVRSLERRPLEPEVTKRLRNGPVMVKSVFEASGQAEHGRYGKLVRGSYYYVTTVIARSEVLEKNEGEGGSIRVVEKRTFTQAVDNLSLSDVDVAVDLSTLPVAQVYTMANTVCTVVAGIAGYFGYGEAVSNIKIAQKGIQSAFAALYSLDGTSARGLLGLFGVEVPSNIDAFVNEKVAKIASKSLDTVHSALQSITGKTFIITYVQDAKGKPLNVDFRHESGARINDAEWEILRTANAFLDQNIVPDTRCEVGDHWTIWADEASELFGLGTDGQTDGKIRVMREKDQPDGNWTLAILPTEITYRGNGGTGTLSVKDGVGLVDAKSASVKTIQATATGDMGMLSKERHWMFFDFVQKTKGLANMRFTLATEPAGE